MKRHVTISWICALLTLLWVYAATSKLFHYKDFLIQLGRQPVPEWSIGVLSVGLPVLELIAATLLCYRWTRKVGLWLSLGLMISFSVYVGLALGGAYGNIPCSCGGILNSMGWRTHFVFNIAYTVLAFAGVWLTTNKSLNIQARMRDAPE